MNWNQPEVLVTTALTGGNRLLKNGQTCRRTEVACMKYVKISLWPCRAKMFMSFLLRAWCWRRGIANTYTACKGKGEDAGAWKGIVFFFPFKSCRVCKGLVSLVYVVSPALCVQPDLGNEEIRVKFVRASDRHSRIMRTTRDCGIRTPRTVRGQYSHFT